MVPAKGEVALDATESMPVGFYQAIGYRKLGPRALRTDMAERLAAEMRKLVRKGPAEATGELISLSGSSREAFVAIAGSLGFRAVLSEDTVKLFAPKSNRKKKGIGKVRARLMDPASPFAKLADMEIAR
jgi:ATP-dependent RNA helicase SUPV3L1/SUV3